MEMKIDHTKLKMMPLIISPQKIPNPLYVNTESVTLRTKQRKKLSFHYCLKSINQQREHSVGCEFSLVVIPPLIAFSLYLTAIIGTE